MKHAICAFLLLLSASGYSQILPAFGASRSGTVGMQFLKIGPDARSNSLGGAAVSDVEDASAFYWNPAGLVTQDSIRLKGQFGHTNYFAGSSISSVGLVWQTNSFRSFGIAVMNMQSEMMPVTTEFMPEGTGQEFGVNNVLVCLSYAQLLTDNFRFGVNLKYANEQILDVLAQSVLVDFGFQYHIGVRDIRFGVNMSNFGFNVQPNGEVKLTNLSGERTVDQFEEYAVPATFRLGLSGALLDVEKHKIRLSAQLNHPTDNKETLAFGLEYGFNELLYLRSAALIGFGAPSPSFGFGLSPKRRFGSISLDYAYVMRGYIGAFQQLSIGFTWN